jgi:hypothetical protein
MNKSISLKTIVALCSLMLLGLAAPGMAKSPGGGGNSCGYNVTSVIADTDTNFNGLPFQLQSDGNGVYSPGVNGVTSQIASSVCDWVLNLINSTRAVNLTLDYQLSGSNSAPFIGPTPVSANIISNCQNNPANTLNYGTMSGGQTLQCPIEADFTYGSNSYRLRMDPDKWTGSTWVQVACTSATGSLCSQWAVGPIPNWATDPDTNPANEPAAIGELIQVTTSGGKGKVTLTPLGLYYVAFSITISK